MHDTAPRLGILRLDTTFERIVGDTGNPASWPFPVHIEVVAGAHARPTVEGRIDLAPFVAAMHRCEAAGVSAITTTCGFLARQQQALAEAARVPVATSALLAYPRLRARWAPEPAARIGILTISGEAFDAPLSHAAGLDGQAVIVGLPRDGVFARVFLDGTAAFDARALAAEIVAVASAAAETQPAITGWLLECANMPPWRHAIAAATGRPVYDALSLGLDLVNGVRF
jgi:hypothetical protein